MYECLHNTCEIWLFKDKNKNISKINNSTILDRAIKVALNSKIFDKIFINSDSNSYLLNSKSLSIAIHIKRKKIIIKQHFFN